MNIIIDNILPVFAIIAMGYFLKKNGIMKEETENFLNNLAYYLVLPAMIFMSVIKMPFAEAFNLRSILGIYLTGVIIFVLALLFSFTLEQKKQGAFVSTAYRSNIAYIGYPIIMNIYGASGLGKIGVLTGFLAPFFIMINIIYLSMTDKKKKGKDNFAALVFSDPLVLTSFISLVFCYFGWAKYIPKFATNTIDMLSLMGSPMMLIAVGAGLKFETIRADRFLIALSAFVKLALMPLIAFLIFRYLIVIPNQVDFNIAILTVAFPTALSTYVLVKKYHSDAPLCAAIITVNTTLSVITISAWAWLLTK